MVRVMRTTRLALLLAPLLALFVIAAAPSHAEAQRRPLYAGFGIGGYAFWTDNLGGCCDVHFRAQGEFGWHPSGDDTGFFLAGELIITGGRNYFMFMPGLRLGGDIPVHETRDLTVFLRPSGLAGGGFWDPDGPDNTFGFFVLQPAFDIRLALADHLIQLWFRPVAFDLLFFPGWYGDFHFAGGYNFMAGLDFAF